MWVSWWLALCFGAISLEKQVESLQVQKHIVKVKEEWKYLDFKFPNNKERTEAIASRRYDYKKCVPIDVDEWRGTKFITVIGDEGVPASLNTVSKEKGDGGPLLEPYPDWSWYNHKDCNKQHIISVYRVAIDKCDRLWVVDNGMEGSKFTCPPQLLSFDLTTKKLLKAITVPKEFAVNSTTGEGLLVTPIVHTLGSSCRETHVYIADPEGYAIVVYDNRASKWARVTSSALVFDPSAETYTIEKQSFKLKDGPVGMALSPTGKKLYLSPMSSYNMVSVNIFQLGRAQGIDDSVPFEVYNDILPTQSSAKAMAKDGTLFFGLVNSTSIACWNNNNPLTQENMVIIAQGLNTLQFTSGMKIKDKWNENGVSPPEVMMALTNRYQKVATNTMNFEEINFRIVEGDVKRLTKGTACEPRRCGPDKSASI